MLPGTDDREFVGGMTGTGKTTFIMKQLLEKQKTEKNTIFIVIDAGEQFETQTFKESWKEYKKDKAIRITDKTNLNSLKPGYIYVYRPNGPTMDDVFITKLLRWIFKTKQVCLVVDEYMELCPSSVTMHYDLEKIIKQGRKRHICVIGGSQRPSGLPLITITESAVVAVFYLQNDNDRARFGKWIHEDFYQKVTGHNFRFFNRHTMEKPVLIIQERGKDNDTRRSERRA